MKKSFQAEMDGTQQAISQIVCWCTTIALHQEFGVGKIRLDRMLRFLICRQSPRWFSEGDGCESERIVLERWRDGFGAALAH